MDQSRIDSIKKSIYYITKPMQDKYSFGITTIFSNKNIPNIYIPSRFELINSRFDLIDYDKKLCNSMNNFVSYGYSRIQEIQGSEKATEQRFAAAMRAAMNGTLFSSCNNSDFIGTEPKLESDFYYHHYVGTFLVENHCEINKKIFELLNIISVSIELEEHNKTVTQQISLNINNDSRSWISSSTFDIKNDPVFLLSLQQLLKSNYNLSIEEIKKNIFEAISLIELFEY